MAVPSQGGASGHIRPSYCQVQGFGAVGAEVGAPPPRPEGAW